MAAIGILGGSFNPPHRGHLALVQAARRELSLERVLLMALHAAAHKPMPADPGPQHRLAMCRLLADGQPGVDACALELQRPGPSYTADTLAELHARDPEAELTFIVGADTAATLTSWHRPQSVIELARLAVARRPGTDGGEVMAALAQIAQPGQPEPRVDFLAMPAIEVSSSAARARLAAGEAVEDMLTPAVAGYIAEHHLYGAGG